MSRLVSIIAFLCICLSCSIYTKQKFNVEFNDRQALAFTGKGAAAGIMLDAVMGGVGVAIGIAIDEGIAKEIAKSIYVINPHYDFLQVVKHELRTNKGLSASQKRLLTRVIVSHYGFRTFSVVDSNPVEDGVSPWLGITFECTGKMSTINYPEDFQQPLVAELPAIKVQGAFAAEQLSVAIRQVIDHWVKIGACNPD